MAIYLAAILIVAAAALFVAAPLTEGFRPRRRSPRLELERIEHERGLALQGLRELDFDHEMGKLDEGDYSDLRRGLEERALRAMRALEKLGADLAATDRPQPRRTVASVTALPSRPAPPAAASSSRFNFCPRCGGRAGAAHNFCAACGSALGTAPPRAPAPARRAE